MQYRDYKKIKKQANIQVNETQNTLLIVWPGDAIMGVNTVGDGNGGTSGLPLGDFHFPDSPFVPLNKILATPSSRSPICTFIGTSNDYPPISGVYSPRHAQPIWERSAMWFSSYASGQTDRQTIGRVSYIRISLCYYCFR